MYTYASATLNVMINAARKAGRLLVRDFNELSKLTITPKSAKSFVTSADIRSEKMLIADLQSYRGDYNMLSEEREFQKGESSNITWIIDPLDGTVNFMSGIPFFCIAIALRRGKDITHGVIYDPMLDIIFYAEKGCGAYMNNTRLRVSSKTLVPEGMIAMDHHYYVENYQHLKDHVHYIRHLGSASLSLAYVASGKLDAFIGHGLEIWDRAAGIIMIKEAGGQIDDLEKKQHPLEAPTILAGNTGSFKKFRELLTPTKESLNA